MCWETFATVQCAGCCAQVDPLVARLVRRRDHVGRAVVKFVMVDRVADREARRHHAVVQADPPIEGVSERAVAVERRVEEAVLRGRRVALWQRRRVDTEECSSCE